MTSQITISINYNINYIRYTNYNIIREYIKICDIL